MPSVAVREQLEDKPPTDWCLPEPTNVLANAHHLQPQRSLDGSASDAEPPTRTASPTQEEAIKDETNDMYSEWLMPGLQMKMKLHEVLASEQSAVQKVEILRTFFGKTLVLDGYTQSAQFDEFVYHESLVHPAMLRVAAVTGAPPRRVFIGGGGELATAREVLRYPSVEQVVMVDLDECVVRLCETLLPEWGGTKVTSDPRFKLFIGDAYQYLMTQPANTKYDAIIMDISDPVEAGPGIALYTQEFYQRAASLLTPGGVFVTQSGAADAVPYQIQERSDSPDCMSLGPIRNTLSQVFDQALPYSTNIASFGGDWGFVMAFDLRTEKKHNILDWKKPSHSAIDQLIERHIQGGADRLHHYDEESHLRMFSLTKQLRKYLEAETRIMTMENPIYTF